LLKKITTAGKDPVTTVPAVISIHLLIMRKNINSLEVYITKQPKHNNKNNNTSKASTSPFPSSVASDQ
jgi:hypothetical protein